MKKFILMNKTKKNPNKKFKLVKNKIFNYKKQLIN